MGGACEVLINRALVEGVDVPVGWMLGCLFWVGEWPKGRVVRCGLRMIDCSPSGRNDSSAMVGGHDLISPSSRVIDATFPDDTWCLG